MEQKIKQKLKRAFSVFAIEVLSVKKNVLDIGVVLILVTVETIE